MVQADLLLVSPYWRTRAYLRAQLKEEGVAVVAFSSISDARSWVKASGHIPRVVLVDLWRQNVRDRDLEWLRSGSSSPVVFFLLGASEAAPRNLEHIGRVVRRPVSVGGLVERLKRAVAEAAA